jgi:hypothetical protein
MFFARKLKTLQTYGRKLTHHIHSYGRKFEHHAKTIGEKLVAAHNGPYSEAAGRALVNAAGYAGRLADSANALDRNRPAEALQHLGFN